MVRKPARMYRYPTNPPYTRKEYIGGIPYPRIRQFVMGNLNRDFRVTLGLQVLEKVVVRHTALEAIRVTINRFMQKKVGNSNFRLEIVKYPHHVLREHKMATGAGADRISEGMRKAFGRPVGTAAILDDGDILVKLHVEPEHVPVAKEALRKAYNKIAPPCRIVVLKGQEFVR
ncbi:MAG: 50S ribosomal protein L16 [Thermoplasmata archaeon]|nr:MAG: 50S ribosomal protein L16 [Thermoplasmata archaeon]HDJ27240.1 50S ribosomal protein L16 [Aciduliprofundum sp.]